MGKEDIVSSDLDAMAEAIQEADDTRADIYFKDTSLNHVNLLYMANATRESSSTTLSALTKSVHDLIADARVIEEYLRGEFDE